MNGKLNTSQCDEKKSEKKELLAKKDFVIRQNSFVLEIKKGDDLSGVPKKYIQNLKTEGVL